MLGPFLGALDLQRVLGYDALQTGLAFLPMTVVMGTLSVRFGEPLITRFGVRTLLLYGMAIIAAALALFTRTPVDGVYVTDVLPVMVLLGLGVGVCFPGLMTIAMSGATPQDAGLASGLVNTSAQVGGAVGLAVLATLSSSRRSSCGASIRTRRWRARPTSRSARPIPRPPRRNRRPGGPRPPGGTPCSPAGRTHAARRDRRVTGAAEDQR